VGEDDVVADLRELVLVGLAEVGVELPVDRILERERRAP